MLLRVLTVFIIGFWVSSSFAKDWSITKKENEYVLVSGEHQFEIDYNGEPRILNVEEKNGLQIIDYFSGDYGTTQKTSITRRIVISDKMQMIVDETLLTKTGEERIESKWEFDLKNKKIRVLDPDLEIPNEYSY